MTSGTRDHSTQYSTQPEESPRIDVTVTSSAAATDSYTANSSATYTSSQTKSTQRPRPGEKHSTAPRYVWFSMNNLLLSVRSTHTHTHTLYLSLSHTHTHTQRTGPRLFCSAISLVSLFVLLYLALPPPKKYLRTTEAGSHI